MLVSDWAVAAASLLAGGFGFFLGLILHFWGRRCCVRSDSRALCTSSSSQYLMGLFVCALCVIAVAVPLAVSNDAGTKHESSRSSYKMEVSLNELVAAVVVSGAGSLLLFAIGWYYLYEKKHFASLDLFSMIRIPLFALIAGIMVSSIVGLAVGLDGHLVSPAAPATRPSTSTLFWSGFGFGAGVFLFLSAIGITLVFYQETVSMQQLRGAVSNELMTRLVGEANSDSAVVAGHRLQEQLLSSAVVLALKAIRADSIDEGELSEWPVERYQNLLAATIVGLVHAHHDVAWTQIPQADAAAELAEHLAEEDDVRELMLSMIEDDADESDPAVGAAMRFVTDSALCPVAAARVEAAVLAAIDSDVLASSGGFGSTRGSHGGSLSDDYEGTSSLVSSTV
eukprot:c54013_g1_i1.p2 GENE.c54013_g1_i1~~c54013_g1_i1.p2  ORF type:complete len:396 (-),score=56.62 c54013_g1_i1:1542-2729(-)